MVTVLALSTMVFAQDYSDPTLSVTIHDEVHTEQDSTVVLDYRADGHCYNDVLVDVHGTKSVGNIGETGKKCSAEVATFTLDHGMQLFDADDVWTDYLGDKLRIPEPPPPVTVPVTVWSVAPDDTAAARRSMAATSLIFWDSRTGIDFDVEFVDLSTNASFAKLFDVASSQAFGSICEGGDHWFDWLRAADALHDDRINIYRVAGSFSETGVACIGDYRHVAVVSTVAHESTTAHEIGHQLSLGHVGPGLGVSSGNIMGTGDKSKRWRFTLGQAWRMNTNHDSLIQMWGLSDLPERDCPCTPLSCSTSAVCPELALE